jgi:hypothetical protein
MGPNLVRIRYGNFSALLYTALQETFWRLKTTGERTGLLPTVVSLIHSMYAGISLSVGHVYFHTFFFFRTEPFLVFVLKGPIVWRNLLPPSLGLVLFGWEDRVIEFATKLYGVTFQKTVVIFFVWESQGSLTHLVTSFGAPLQISFMSHREGTKYSFDIVHPVLCCTIVIRW